MFIHQLLLPLLTYSPSAFPILNFILPTTTSRVAMKRSTSQEGLSTTGFPSTSTSFSTSSAPFSLKESTSTLSSSEFSISGQQNSIQPAHFRSVTELKEALSQAREYSDEIYLEGICLDDELIQTLVKLNQKKLFLQNCNFAPNNSIGFDHALKLLNHGDSPKPCFRFAVQFNESTTQWTICDKSPGLEFNKNEHITSLLFILSSDIPKQPSLSDVSSLIFLPPNSDISKPLSSQSKKNLRSIMDHLSPKLKHLSFMYVNFDGPIEDFISISQSKLDLIYIWNCDFETSDPLWISLVRSAKLIGPTYTGKIQSSQFAIPMNGHTIQIVLNFGPSLLLPNSPSLIQGLILSLGQGLPSDLSLDDTSLLTFLPSKVDLLLELSKEVLSSQSKENLKSVMSRRHPKLKRLLLTCMNFGGGIEDCIPILQLKLDLIYIQNCAFEAKNYIWSLLANSVKLAGSTHKGEAHDFHFAISIDGHTTQILFNNEASFVMPNSPDLNHGLILFLGQNVPSDLPLNDISFIALLPSKMDHLLKRSREVLSSQSKENLKSVMSCRYPKLRRLLLECMHFDDHIEDYIPFSQLKLDFIYLRNCMYVTGNPIWSLLTKSVRLVGSIHKRKVQGIQFSIPLDDHVTQIVFNKSPSFPMPNSSDVLHGLVLSPGQSPPEDLVFDNVSFLAFSSSKTNPIEVLSLQDKQNLKSVMNCPCPRLKYILLKNIDFGGDIEELLSISRVRLNLIYLSFCNFKSNDPIWTLMTESMEQVKSMQTEKPRDFLFAIPNNEHTTHIIISQNQHFLMPNSSYLTQGLILHLGQSIPDDLLLDGISFLILLPPEMDPNKSSSSQSKPNLDSIMSRQWPKELKCLYLKDISIDKVEGMLGFIQQFSKLEVHNL